MKFLTWIVSAALVFLICPSSTGALPDLTPTALEVPSAITDVPYPQVTMTWSVTNQGAAQTLQTVDGIYISTNWVLDNTATQAGTWYEPSGPLGAGAEYRVTNTFSLPLFTSGNYYVLLKTDVYNWLSELDEDNNIIVSPLRFEATPADLALASVQVTNPFSGPPNPILTVSWAVTNQGIGTAVGGWLDAIYFSTNSTWTPDATFLAYLNFYNPLPSGQIYWATNAIRVPVIAGGTYYLFFKTDIYNSLYETNLANNILAVPLTLTIRPPDLAPLALQAPANVADLANPLVTIIWGVTNQGTGAADPYWTDRLFVSTNEILDENTAISISYNYETGPLAPGGSYWRTNLVHVPVVQSGKYYLIFQTDSQNVLVESNLSNNVRSLPITFNIQQPDLAPLSFQTPTVVTSSPNPTLTLVWGVTNQGNGATSGSWVDDVYLSRDAVLDPTDTPISGQYEYNRINPTDVYWRTNTVQIPLTHSGAYYLIFKTDNDNTLNESNTNNNISVVRVVFNILPPNLAPILLQAPALVTGPPKPTVQFAWGVTNRGTGAAATYPYWYDGIYLSSDPQFDSADVLIYSSSEFGPVPSGGTYWRTNAIQVPVTESGKYYLLFRVNQGSSLFESDYTDNTIVAPITFNIAPPDLAPVTSLMPKTIIGPPYPTVDFIWGTTNQGIGPATGTAWNDYVYFSTNSALGYGETTIVYGSGYGPIAPGTTAWQTNTVRVPVTQSGRYYFIFQNNVSHYLFESDYNNNLAAVPVTFDIRLPDLAPITLQAPSVLNGPPFPTVTLVYGVTNQGAGAAIGNWYWPDRVYLSSNPVWDQTAASVLTLSEQGPIAPGESYWRTNTVRLPISQSGAYYLFFKTAADEALIEADISNNLASAALTFNAQPPDLAPVNLQVPSAVTGPPYPSVTYVWGVTNQGTGPALAYNNSWNDAVWLSTNSSADWSNPQIGSSYQSGPVPVGSVYWQTNTLRVPVTRSGTYYFVFKTDADNSLVESDYSNNVAAVPITFTILPPDLVPISLGVPQVITGAPNPVLNLVWGVTNQGSGPAVGNPQWVDQIYLSTQPVLDPQSTTLVYNYESGPIDASQAYWRSNTVQLPIVQSGNYYLILAVDGYNELFESGESNNTLVVPATFNILPPDLLPVTSLISNFVVGSPNPSLTLVWGVTNQGTGPALRDRFGNSAWQNRIYLSADPKLDGQDQLISTTFDWEAIEPGGVSWQTNTVYAPVLQSGTNYLIFQVNADNYRPLYESDYSNNVQVVPVAFEIRHPDLVPLSLDLPKVITGPPNPMLTIVWGVTNQGAGSAASLNSWPTWSDVLYLSTNASLDQAQRLIDTDTGAGPIAPGGTYWRTNLIRVPIVQSGTYYFTLQTDANGYLSESDYANNFLVLPVTFNVLPPDLAPAALQVPMVLTSAPNPRLTLVWGVTNQGIGLAEGNWNDTVYLSTNSTLDASAYYLYGSYETGPTAAGASYWRTNSFLFPVVQSGTYYLLFTANANNTLYESNPNNNLLVVPLTFTILPPDLAPIALEAPAEVTGPPNPTFNLAWGVTNQGIGPASLEGSWADRVYLSADPVLEIWNDPVIVSQSERGPIAPGHDYWRSQVAQVPVVASGSYYLIFKTDADGSLYESNETNNSVVVPITFRIQPPDLAPISLQPTGVIGSSPNPTIKLTWAVTNQGAGAAIGSWIDNFYLSADSVLDSADKLLGTRWENGPLPAGSSYWRAQNFQVPVTASGKYYLLLQTGSYNQLYEADESNNVMAVPITFNISSPDLVPVAFQAPTSVTGAPNPTVTLVWGVTNQGLGSALTADYPWADQVYLSTNVDLDVQTAILLPSVYESGPLPAGESYWRTNKVQLPVTEDGTYHLFFEANGNYYGRLQESDYSNNGAVAHIVLHISQPDLAPITFQVPGNLTGSSYPSVTLFWGVTNQGLGSAGGDFIPWTDYLYLYKTNPADGTQSFLQSWNWPQTNIVPAGQSYWSTNNVILPIVESGTYSLTLAVDSYDQLHESVTTNNLITAYFTVNVDASDIAPIFFGTPGAVTGPLGTMVTVAWGATNQGGATPPVSYYWYDQLWVSTQPSLDSSAVFVRSWPQNAAIPAGDSYWRTNTVQLPVQASGNYYFILQLDSYNSLKEPEFSNNVAVIPVTLNVPPLPDLAAVLFQAPLTITSTPNPRVTFVWGVTNKSSGPADNLYGWYDALFFSTSPVLNATDSPVTSFLETNSVPPGGAYWRTNSVTLPVTASGTYYLIFDSDYYNATLLESDYGNNTAVLPISFTIMPPDLSPIVFQAPNTITGPPNPNVTLIIGVTNLGAGAASAAIDSVYVSATPIHDLSARLVANWSRTNTVPVGGAYWLTNTVRVPVEDGGNYYLLFEADTGNYLAESNLSNNVAVIPIRFELSLEPDLAVTEFRAPQDISGPPNPAIPLAWHVVNEGLGPAVGPWSDSVLLYTNGAFAQGTLLGSFNEAGAIPVGVGYWRTNWIRLPLSQSGSYYLSFQTDGANELFELDQANNYWWVPFTFRLTAPVTVNISGSKLNADGSFEMAVSGPNGTIYTLQTSTNLLDWVRTCDFICTDPPTWISDPEARNFVRRFYRVVPYAGAAALRLAFASPSPWGSNGPDFKLDGPLARPYRIEFSSDLANWRTVTNLLSNVSPVYFRDDSATSQTARFYRAVTP